MSKPAFEPRTPGPLLLGLGIPALLLLGGCRAESRPEVTAEEGVSVVGIAEPAVTELQRTLVGRLTAAMEEGGAAGAVEFCSMDAIPLTRLVEAGLEGGLSLKRTSFRIRNQDNTPDEAEVLALRFFEDAFIEHGEAPAHFVQRVSEDELRFYKPLFVAEFCLQCHGSRDTMDQAVRAVLDARYPGDLATGYRAGDFRGVVRVTVPAALVQEG